MQDILGYAVDCGRALGAKFVEARYEDISVRTMLMETGSFRDVVSTRRRGLCMTAHVGDSAGFSYTASMNKADIKSACRLAYKLGRGANTIAIVKSSVDAMEPYVAKDLRLQTKVHPRDVSIGEKKDLLVRANDAAKENGERISSTVVRFGELYGTKMVVNSEGTSVSWEPLVHDLRCMVVSKGMGGELADGGDGVGGTFGFERFSKKGFSPETVGENAAIWAKEKLKAKAAPAGEFRALCEHLLTGVLAHESFGHLTEGDFVISKSSPLAGKVGEKLGSEHATIVDEGPLDASKYSPFWLPVDDQGVPTGRTVLLDKGVFKGYLHSRVTASALGDRPSGNARAINFCFPPIPRMTNTYFMPGDMTEDEAVRELGTGIYAIRSHGGQVNMDGTFLFKAARGYWVEKGEIRYPLKDVVLMDSILKFIQNVEGATKDLDITSGYFGGCGKGEQYPLPVGLGGPDLLLSKVRFGGEAR